MTKKMQKLLFPPTETVDLMNDLLLRHEHHCENWFQIYKYFRFSEDGVWMDVFTYAMMHFTIPVIIDCSLFVPLCIPHIYSFDMPLYPFMDIKDVIYFFNRIQLDYDLFGLKYNCTYNGFTYDGFTYEDCKWKIIWNKMIV